MRIKKNTGLKDDPARKIMYIELNEKIERMSKLVHFVLIKVCYSMALIPIPLTELINYFILDMKDESFQEKSLMCVNEKKKKKIEFQSRKNQKN